MRTYDLSGIGDDALVNDLEALVARERADLATVLAHIAEVDLRRLYLHEGFPSMYAYCLGKLKLSEQSAMKRIRAGRVARRFPRIFEAVAGGRLHLSAVVLLAHHMTPENFEELIRAVEGRSKFDIELLLASRFPRPDVPADIQAIAPLLTAAAIQAPSIGRSAAGSATREDHGLDAQDLIMDTVESEKKPGEMVQRDETKLSPGTVDVPAHGGAAAAPAGTSGTPQRDETLLSPGTVDVPAPSRPARVMPLAPERFAVRFTIGKETFDDLRSVQALLSHSVPGGDVAQVFALSLKELKHRLERRKFAATDRPRARQRQAGVAARFIPADVKRAVWARDQGQCTFVSESGQRCGSQRFLEFDHIDPVARGGRATVESIRLRCRGHNQLEAERVFGKEFMARWREDASHLRMTESGSEASTQPRER